MGQAYSADLRSRVIKAAADGMSARQAADRFGVGASPAIVGVRRYRQSGEAAGQLPAHESVGVRTAIEAAGASRRHLRPYSPDFDPIEQAFSKLKALLREAAARTILAFGPPVTAGAARATGRDERTIQLDAGPWERPSSSSLAHDPGR